MKAISHTYQEVISHYNLLLAWGEFASEKQKRADVREFSPALLHNILDLRQDLGNFTYEHSGYEMFTVNDPKPRKIHKAAVRDRLLHQAIYRVLYPDFDDAFINDSYSCRDEKGTHAAFKQLARYCRQVSQNYVAPCFAIQMDIRKFFDNIDHEVLLALLQKQIVDRDLLGLLTKVIFSFEHNPGKGMPLGNLTSQLFANIYLDPLDKFVKHKLKAKRYLRYADDFLILDNSSDVLMGYFVEIWRFLKEELKLNLHPNKIKLRKLSQGIDFVGYVVRSYYSIPRRKTAQRMLRNISCVESPEKLAAVLQSYIGHLGHVSAKKIEGELRLLASVTQGGKTV